MDPLPPVGPSPHIPSDHGTDVAAAFEKCISRFEIFCDYILEEPSPNDPTATEKYYKTQKKKLL